MAILFAKSSLIAIDQDKKQQVDPAAGQRLPSPVANQAE
jgi:hypothetical protein